MPPPSWPDLLQHCLNVSGPVPDIVRRRYAVLHNVTVSQEALWHNGNSGRLAQQIACYYGLAARYQESGATVCETGYNVGHSAVTFLSALNSPLARYVGFDLGQLRRLTWSSVNLLNRSFFPGQVTMTYGRSTRTLPAFLAQHPTLRCDILSIDGDHSLDGMRADWELLRAHTHANTTIFVDDIAFPMSMNRARVTSSVAVHTLFREYADLELIGCARLRGLADAWADPGLITAAPSSRRPGGYNEATGRAIRGLPASPGVCVARRRAAGPPEATAELAVAG